MKPDAASGDPRDAAIESIMHREFATIRADERLDLVDDLMRLGRIRHLPVVDDEGLLLGIVSQRDLLAASLSRVLDFGQSERRTFLRSVQASEVMTRQPIHVAPSTSLREAARLMLQHKIGCLPVVNGSGAMVGLVTDSDLLRGAYGVPEGTGAP